MDFDIEGEQFLWIMFIKSLYIALLLLVHNLIFNCSLPRLLCTMGPVVMYCTLCETECTLKLNYNGCTLQEIEYSPLSIVKLACSLCDSNCNKDPNLACSLCDSNCTLHVSYQMMDFDIEGNNFYGLCSSNHCTLHYCYLYTIIF